MTEPDPVAEARALAETLRAAIRELDERVEDRADEIASDLFLQAQRLGLSNREYMLVNAPNKEGYDALVKIPAEMWTADAARDLCLIYSEISMQEAWKGKRWRRAANRPGAPHPRGQSSGDDT